MIGRRISHYRILEHIGAGGMGAVFLAEDLALGRPTALKLLPDRVQQESLRARLRQEARLIARLQHPAIATFYEAGEDNGIFYLAMEFVPGETLRARLQRGPLPVDQALGVTTALLEALGHAHAVGVLHRDIKPENVMLSPSGAVKLLDFGIAKAMDLAGPEDVTRETGGLTLAGAILGTPGYLAPEQVEGGSLGPAADLFALGTVLFEMVHGRPAFPGRTDWERVQAVRAGLNPSAIDGSLSPALRALLARALTVDRSGAFRTAAEFLAALQSIGHAAAEAILPDSLAILPLSRQGGEESDAWIGAAVADTLIADLSRLQGLGIVARERAGRALQEAAADGADALTLGRRLGCRWVLAGSFTALGERIRIVPMLTEVGTGRVAWSEKLDGARADLFALQDRLAGGVAAALSLRLQPKETRERPAIDAYELCARAKTLFARLEKGTFETAASLMEQAIGADPEFAEPYVRLCSIHAMRFTFQTDRRDLEVCRAHATRAVSLDPRLAEPHVYLCYALWRLGEPEAALRAAEEAARLDPLEPRAPYFAGCIQWNLYRRAAAKASLQHAVRLGPDHGFGWLILGSLCGELGEFAEARHCLAQAIEMEGRPGLGPTAGAAAFLAELVRREGRLEEALRICEEALTTIERSDHMYRDSFRGVALVTRGRIGLDLGDRAAAEAAFRQTISHLEGRERTLGGGHLMAQAHAGLAELLHDRAELERAESVFGERERFDHSWLWLLTREFTLWTMGRAAHALGEAGRGQAHWEAARRTGFTAALLEGLE